MGSINMPAAAQSPRIVNRVLKWYEGDTFTINWYILLKKNNIPFEYDPTDKLIFSFFKDGQTIHSFSFTNIPSSKMVSLEFTRAVSQKFKVGRYTYCIKYVTADGSATDITTIGAMNALEVEKCH